MNDNAKKDWIVYLLKCSDNSLYCGITNNLEKRVTAHNEGKGARYTRGRVPVTLIQNSMPMGKSDALKLERQIKRTPRHRKISLLEQFQNSV